MSWRTGANLIVEIWPIVKKHIQREEDLEYFSKGLLKLFISNDIDTDDIKGLDPLLDKLIADYYRD